MNGNFEPGKPFFFDEHAGGLTFEKLRRAKAMLSKHEPLSTRPSEAANLRCANRVIDIQIISILDWIGQSRPSFHNNPFR